MNIKLNTVHSFLKKSLYITLNKNFNCFKQENLLSFSDYCIKYLMFTQNKTKYHLLSY